MKVYITDLRVKPRIVYIDGKRYIFPSRKEVLRDISKTAYLGLEKTPYLKLRPLEVENNITENIPNVVVRQPSSDRKPERTSCSSSLSLRNEDNVVLTNDVEVSIKDEPTPVSDEQVSNDTVGGDFEETLTVEENKVSEEDTQNTLEESITEETITEEPISEETVSNEVDSVKPDVNYTSMSKKELKAVIEGMGVDTTGMTKALMLEWLASH
jgi:hypothetical protein